MPSGRSQPFGAHGDPRVRMKSKARADIREVANAAGVAVSSVSRVMSNHPDVSPAMKKRVNDAARTLGYEPDIVAQSMRKGSTRTIGFLVSDISNPLFSQIALGVETALNSEGYAMLIANSQGNPHHDAKRIRLLRQRRVDGFILSLADEENSAGIAQLRALDRPFVLLDREVQGLAAPAVVSDHEAGMRTAVEHLVHLGHRSIGLVCTGGHVRPSKTRIDAVLAACREHRGVSAIVEAGCSTAAHGEAATEMLLSRRIPPTAIIATTNETLIGVLKSLRRHDIDVPREMSLITCDPLPLSELLEPSLATIGRDPVQMGSAAAELILETLRGKIAGKVTLPVTFDPKESCGPAQAKAILRPVRVR
jgi:LacI family transcriptional regulator